MTPSYCSNVLEGDTIPPEDLMEYWQPYAAVPSGCTHVEVKIKVPSNCYFIESDSPTPPDEGACGAADDYQHTITVNKNEPCSNTDDHILSLSLNYHEDASGHRLYIYVFDAKERKVKKAVKTKRRLDT